MFIEDIKDFTWRVVHTFWQTFSAVFLIPDDLLDLGAWESTVAAAVAAGLSAVKGLVSQALRERVS